MDNPITPQIICEASRLFQRGCPYLSGLSLGVVRLLAFKKRPTLRWEIDSTMPRWTTSLACLGWSPMGNRTTTTGRQFTSNRDHLDNLLYSKLSRSSKAGFLSLPIVKTRGFQLPDSYERDTLFQALGLHLQHPGSQVFQSGLLRRPTLPPGNIQRRKAEASQL